MPIKQEQLDMNPVGENESALLIRPEDLSNPNQNISTQQQQQQTLDPSTGLTCLACQLVFATPTVQRDHYRTEWHRYNVKRRVAGLVPVPAQVFEEKARQFAEQMGVSDQRQSKRNQQRHKQQSNGQQIFQQGGEFSSTTGQQFHFPSLLDGQKQQQTQQHSEQRDLYCSVCRKPFQSQAALGNHLQSKRHRELANSVSEPEEETGSKTKITQQTKNGPQKKDSPSSGAGRQPTSIVSTGTAVGYFHPPLALLSKSDNNALDNDDRLSSCSSSSDGWETVVDDGGEGGGGNFWEAHFDPNEAIPPLACLFCCPTVNTQPSIPSAPPLCSAPDTVVPTASTTTVLPSECVDDDVADSEMTTGKGGNACDMPQNPSHQNQQQPYSYLMFPDQASQMEHMCFVHGFHLPDWQFCTDLGQLLAYLAAKVGSGKTCIRCNLHRFRDVAACQKHMRDKGHCNFRLDKPDTLLEMSDFYDYSIKQENDGGDGDDDDTDLVAFEDDSGAFLVLPSGARIGHRYLVRYFRQRLKPELQPNQDKALEMAGSIVPPTSHGKISLPNASRNNLIAIGTTSKWGRSGLVRRMLGPPPGWRVNAHGRNANNGAGSGARAWSGQGALFAGSAFHGMVGTGPGPVALARRRARDLAAMGRAFKRMQLRQDLAANRLFKSRGRDDQQ